MAAAEGASGSYARIILKLDLADLSSFAFMSQVAEAGNCDEAKQKRSKGI